MSDPIRSISQNNFILADQKEVSHDNTLSGNGTEASPLGVNVGSVGSQLVISTVENVAFLDINNSQDTAISGDFTKTGYTPISFVLMFGFSAWINANLENTIIENNTLKLRGYARTWANQTFYNTAFKVLITWMKIS